MTNSYLQNDGHNVVGIVEKQIHWIPPINEIFKFNFDGSKVENKTTLGWVIGDSNGIIKMTISRLMGNTSIIITKCMTMMC